MFSMFYKPADFKIYLHASKLKGSSSTISILVVLLFYFMLPTEFSESTNEFSFESRINYLNVSGEFIRSFLTKPFLIFGIMMLSLDFISSRWFVISIFYN